MDASTSPLIPSASNANKTSAIPQTERVIPIVIRGSSVKLSLPIDKRRASISIEDTESPVPIFKRHRRDSLERREALLKGNEGSRRRQRWENGESTIEVA